MTEEQAFVSLEIMLFQSLRTRWFLNHTFEQHLVFCSTFDSLISMHLPGLYKHMIKLSVSTTESFAKDWFSSLFVGHVKYSIVLRLFDCFLSEGFKVFYRFGLAVLCKCKQYLLKATTTEDFLQILHQAALFSTDSESLFKTAFCFRVKQAQLSKLDKLNSDRIKCHQLLLTSPLKVEPVYYRPIMEKPSSIISQQQCEKIWSMLPHRYGIMDPTLLFSTAVDGFNISTLFTKCGDAFPLLVLVKSPAQHIFGGYLSETIPELAKRGGTQDCESFLFSLHPVEQKYAWTRADHQLACIRDGALVFGGQ
ncbi:rabGTPase-activating protein [Pelomyxa schiedti]|nr:rabGTPase-activating protein [Pelomyxa schiedti]